MISEQHFASSFTSVWNRIIPLADNYWRQENLKITREISPIPDRTPKNIRGFINELAFEVFTTIRSTPQFDRPRTETITSVAHKKFTWIADYILRITNDENSIPSALDKKCEDEIKDLVTNLLHFFPHRSSMIPRPKFHGCGIVSACEGDLIYDNCLYEIKAGDRKFRISDIKQLLVYSSLAFTKENIPFSKVGLFNPRNGYYWEKPLDRLCIELSGMRESDVLPDIASSMMQLSISR